MSHAREAPADGPGARTARQAELGAFLRAQRARVRPAEVGLPDGNPSLRRTPGLRREEVAELAGVSLTWYTWLEQGRDISASAQVIDALARTLRLDADRHRYLRRLAGLPSPPLETATAADDVHPRLQRLVDSVSPDIASVYDVHFDYVVWNKPYLLVRHDPMTLPAERRNMLWMMFTDPENRVRMVGWERAARAVLSQFRTAVGRRPDDPRFAALIAALTEVSPEFREWWAEYPVQTFKPATITILHPDIGRIRLEMFQLRPVEHSDLLLVLQVPVTDDDRGRIAALADHPANPGPGPPPTGSL